MTSVDGSHDTDHRTRGATRQITFTVPRHGPGAVPAGPHQLKITGGQRPDHRQRPDLPRAGRHGSSAYNPTVYEVGPGRQDLRSNCGQPQHAAATSTPSRTRWMPRRPARQALVVVYPGPTDTVQPVRLVLREPRSSTRRSSCRAWARAASTPTARTCPAPCSTASATGPTARARPAGRPRWPASRDDHRPEQRARSIPTTVAPPEGEVILAVATSTTQYGVVLQGRDRRPADPERRRDGLRAERQHPGQRRAGRRRQQHADQPEPGRRHRGLRLDAIPADHQQHHQEQRRRLRRRHPPGHAAGGRQPPGRRPHRQQPHPQQRRHQPGRRGRASSTAPTATRSTTTTCAATSRPSMAAASATSA